MEVEVKRLEEHVTDYNVILRDRNDYRDALVELEHCDDPDLWVMLIAERNDLQAIVAKLPKCWGLKFGKLVQDVPVVPGMEAWINKGTRFLEGPGILSESRSQWTVRTVGANMLHLAMLDMSAYVRVSDCYDSREAAEASEKGETP
jgi:hypothetical protein